MQCCESGIRCLFDPWIRDPGWIKIQDPIRNEHPESYFRELRNNFCVKILKFFDADADQNPGIFLTLYPGSGMEKIRIRGSRINVPDPQHCCNAQLLKQRRN
jgi:hypothetical protein